MVDFFPNYLFPFEYQDIRPMLSGLYAFALLLEEWCWNLTANVSCSEIPDHSAGGDDTAFPLQSF